MADFWWTDFWEVELAIDEWCFATKVDSFIQCKFFFFFKLYFLKKWWTKKYDVRSVQWFVYLFSILYVFLFPCIDC